MRSDFSLNILRKNKKNREPSSPQLLGFLFFFALVLFFSLPLRSDRGRFSRLLFFSSLCLLLFVFVFVFVFVCDGMEREACVCDHGFERSDLCAEIK